MPASDSSLETVYIALGANLGDRVESLQSAVRSLRGLGEELHASSLYETEPVGTVPQPMFLNAVVEMRTAIPPEELLRALLRIEQQHGRDRMKAVPKGPRTLDLDLLAHGRTVLQSSTLTLPHPAIPERRFVLQPLVEIAPDWRHPGLGYTTRELLEELQRREGALAPVVRKFPRTLQPS